MIVELYINGEFKRKWEFPQADYRETWCEAGIEEKERLWGLILEKCKCEAGDAIHECENVQFVIAVPARVQPEDIPDEEFFEFINGRVNGRSESIDKLHKRFKDAS